MDETTIIQFRTCLASEVASREIINGSLIVCYDSGDMYFDTLEGERIKISKQIEFLTSEDDRTSLLTPESDKLYIVKETSKVYIYNNGWGCLNETPFTVCYFYIPSIRINENGNTQLNDSRVDSSATAKFMVDSSVCDLVGNSAITCSCGDGVITVNSNCQYPLLGTIEVTTTNLDIPNAENMTF